MSKTVANKEQKEPVKEPAPVSPKGPEVMKEPKEPVSVEFGDDDEVAWA